MITEKEKKHISKFLSLVLRHKPETIGIELDKEGWADITELIEKSNKYGRKYDLNILTNIVSTNTKKRFSFNSSQSKIRASQGHSINVDLGYSNQEPPDLLYHGTAQNSVDSIIENGIEKRNRQHVHLSNDLETAIKVGQRHGKPYVFKIKASLMYKEGYEFFISENMVWLTEQVPSKYLMKDE